MKKVLLINPFPGTASHGIHNYNINLIKYFKDNNIDFDYYANDSKLSPDQFRVAVSAYVEKNYGTDEVIIEAPEVKASTLLISNDYDIHVRMHTPGAVAQKYDNVCINRDLFGQELEAIHRAKFVSSPSYGLLKELREYLNRNDISVYKNPFNNSIEISDYSDKEFDCIFMGRFQTIKGVEYINDVLKLLPDYFKVVLLGNNASKFKLEPNVSCTVILVEEISGEERFEYVKKSKVLMQLSKFENCSMVNLESIACGTVVCAWDVGGNSEMAPPEVIKIVPSFNVEYFARQVELIVSQPYPLKNEFLSALDAIDEDFRKGISSYTKNSNFKYTGLNLSGMHTYNVDLLRGKLIESHDREYKKFGQRIFGFSLSNEHIEEMWMPIINKFNSDYLFVCRRPLGFMYKFNNPYHVDKNKFKMFDWIKYPNLLIEEIKAYKPNKILFHNGIHPVYQEALDRIKKTFPHVPIIYSELGWFPQLDNIYFDESGTNGKSSIAKQNFEEFCEEPQPKAEFSIPISGDYILIVTQLENDTNLIVNSSRFKSMENFIEYILTQIPDKGPFVIKTHPLDNNKSRFDRFESKNVKVVHDGDLDEILKKSKAVMGINSTVLLESLKYDLNIYMFGKYLLNNKGVVIECDNSYENLSDQWSDTLISCREAKDMIFNEFVKRQINIRSIDKFTVSEILQMKSFKPLLKNCFVYSPAEEFEMTKNILRSSLTSNYDFDMNNEYLKKINENTATLKRIESKILKNNSIDSKGTFWRKYKKFKKTPGNFLRDSRFVVFRSIGYFFK